ncbi:Os02g0210600 [Oryza sativa Japonica Group]|uniref:Os02g0210600 protein n=3 Tax=Oryza TaxID=4527 RepID=Q0E2V6_ORYSJ|nr:hypothetical protein EE612_009692 [Oryza sativa]BAF08182.1 Os02g0210600 [Oryza sativa Japonica Group]BAS77592.1 Os02g0210600 [Oryza sativa Japonica Group]|eukprot:NP_001046268.1 Os02g0210600 [Oryza sativa Japonica Group]
MAVREDVLKRARGSAPVSLFCVRLRNWRDELFAKNSGIPSERPFPPRSTYVRDEPLPNNHGMLPTKVLVARFRIFSSRSVPNPLGMLPCSLLFDRSMSWI